MWFEALLGFKEESPAQVRSQLEIKGPFLNSLVNQRSFRFGSLEVPRLSELRSRNELVEEAKTAIRIKEMVADVQELHQLPENAGALFQAASQFNLLEMISPEVSPEQGVDTYENDLTQGPACAIACGAGTIYRNYFASVNGQIGQSAKQQIDCLADLGVALGNQENSLWEMQNGYALVTVTGLEKITRQFQLLDAEAYETFKGLLRVGVQWDTEVTLSDNRQQVTQVYCSALPVAYSDLPMEEWASFARFVLAATYEATFWVALENYQQTGNNKVYLTLVGGGAFGNRPEWIFEAIGQALEKFRTTTLEVYLVSYGASSKDVVAWIDELKL
jgi:hypothetical protein